MTNFWSFADKVRRHRITVFVFHLDRTPLPWRAVESDFCMVHSNRAFGLIGKNYLSVGFSMQSSLFADLDVLIL